MIAAILLLTLTWRSADGRRGTKTLPDTEAIAAAERGLLAGYEVELDGHPVVICEGTCGDVLYVRPSGNMCYRCQCEAHASGWYNMDTGRVRGPNDRADEEATDSAAHIW
jgi:hypothetical protein